MHSVQSPSRSLDQLAAKLLAAAVCIRCPKAHIVEAREESYGFCVEFYSSESCSEELFPFLEEGMYALLDQKEIQIFEMTSPNAYEFLKFHHQKKRAQILKEWSFGLVSTIKVGGYVDFLEEELDLERALEDLKAIKLISLTHAEHEGPHGEPLAYWRIKGIAAEDTRSLKERVKRVKEASKYSHTQASYLFTEDATQEEKTLLWLPQGVALKARFLQGLKNYFQKWGYQEVENSSHDLDALLTAPQLHSLPAWFALYEESTRNSLEPELGLYSLDRTLSLVGIRYFKQNERACVFKEVLDAVLELMNLMQWQPRIEESSKQEMILFVKDSFEREWEVARVEIGEKKNPCYVTLSLVSTERWLALHLDRSRGALSRAFLDELFKSEEEKRYQENS